MGAASVEGSLIYKGEGETSAGSQIVPWRWHGMAFMINYFLDILFSTRLVPNLLGMKHLLTLSITNFHILSSIELTFLKCNIDRQLNKTMS